jgi:formylglycine-generating enzyme
LNRYVFYIFILCAVEAVAQPTSYTNALGMEFVLIRPGTMVVGKFQPPYPLPEDTLKNAMVMWMGDGRPYSAEEFRLASELAMKDGSPGFEVRIAKPFYMGKFEVTQQQWKKVMGSNPSAFRITDSHPVDGVSWEDVQKFISRLNELDKTNRYRLPTEFEWEYAARAGAKDDIPWDQAREMAHLGGKTTQPVGQKKPNAWGLYDMLGNVWEWVEDFYNEKIFADPRPRSSGDQHVLKGASIAGDVKNATYMTHAGGPGNGWDVGFRLVMEVAEE